MKGKVGSSSKGYQVSSSDQNKSSSLLDLSLLSNSHTVASPSLKYSSTQNSVESDQSEYQYVAFQQQSEKSESVQYKQQQQLQQQQLEQNTLQSEHIQQHQYQQKNVLQEQQQFSIQQQQSHSEYCENESNFQEKVFKDLQQQEYCHQEQQQYSRQETSRKEEVLEKIETASPKSYNQSPFSFKRPTAFNKANGSFGSFGSQLNLASMKEENTLFKMKNVEEMYNRNCTQQALQSSENNLHIFEEQSVQNISQTMNESKMFSTTTKCSELFSQESENYESSSYRIAQNSEESENIKSTNIAESNEGLTYSNDVLDERDHFSAVCRYETSTKSCNDDKDMCQADIERDDETEEDIEDDVKEYSVEAKIIVNPNTGEKEVTTWDNELGHEITRDKTVDKSESNYEDKIECKTQENSEFMNEVMSLGLVQQNFNSTEYFGQSQQQILTEESLNQEQFYEQSENCEEEYEKMEESEMHMNEEKVEYSRENEDVKDYSELFIKEEQKTVINSCIEELEKSTVIDNKTESILDVEKEYEDVNFQTEKIIDTEDLEHVHVKSYKNEERRLSFQHQTQADEIIQMCEQVENIIEEKMMKTCSMDSNMTTTTTSTESIRVNVEENLLEENANQTDARESKSTEEHQDHVGSDEMSSSFFLTETDDSHRSQAMNKRQRNRTIDYHNLPSLYWEASVQNYHEKKFTQNPSEIVNESVTENVSHEVQTEDSVQSDSNLAKDGLSIILQK